MAKRTFMNLQTEKKLHPDSINPGEIAQKVLIKHYKNLNEEQKNKQKKQSKPSLKLVK